MYTLKAYFCRHTTASTVQMHQEAPSTIVQKPATHPRNKTVPNTEITNKLLTHFIEASAPPGQNRPPLKKINTTIQTLILRAQDSGFFPVRRSYLNTTIQTLILRAQDSGFFPVRRSYLDAKNAIITFINPEAPILSYGDNIRIRPFPEAKTPIEACVIDAFHALEIELSAHHPSLFFPPIPFTELEPCTSDDFLNAIGIHTDTYQIQNKRLWTLFEDSVHHADHETQFTMTLKLTTAIPKTRLYDPTINSFIEHQIQALYKSEKDPAPFPSAVPYLHDVRKAKGCYMMAAIGLMPVTYTIQNQTLWEFFKEDLATVSKEEATLTTDALSAAVLQECIRDNTPLFLPPAVASLFNQFGTLKWQNHHQERDEQPFLRDPISQKMSLRLPPSTASFLKKGSYGEIFLSKTLSHQDIVIKTIALNNKHYLNNTSTLFNEIMLSQAVSHPNILPIHEAFIASDAQSIPTAYITMPYCSEGNLQRFVFAETPLLHRLWRNHKVQWEDELVDAVAALHAQEISHSDLKLNNVLVVTDTLTGRLSLKLTDFGFAAYFADEHRYSRERGTPHITPPEVMQTTAPILPENRDLWQLGITLFELNTGKTFTRFREATLTHNYNIQRKIKRSVFTFCFNPQVRSSILKSIDNTATAQGISRLLDADPLKRISANTLKTNYLNHRSSPHYWLQSLQPQYPPPFC